MFQQMSERDHLSYTLDGIDSCDEIKKWLRIVEKNDDIWTNPHNVNNKASLRRIIKGLQLQLKELKSSVLEYYIYN